MDLYEYQARELFREHGVPVLGGAIATTPAQAREVAAELFDAGSSLVVVKAQVKTGGRGKAGGVKPARSAAEAEQRASEILGMDIKGHTVRTVLIADGAPGIKDYADYRRCRSEAPGARSGEPALFLEGRDFVKKAHDTVPRSLCHQP